MGKLVDWAPGNKLQGHQPPFKRVKSSPPCFPIVSLAYYFTLWYKEQVSYWILFISKKIYTYIYVPYTYVMLCTTWLLITFLFHRSLWVCWFTCHWVGTSLLSCTYFFFLWYHMSWGWSLICSCSAHMKSSVVENCSFSWLS